jgi:hypothetical protein
LKKKKRRRRKKRLSISEQGVESHACNSNIQEAKAGLQLGDYLGFINPVSKPKISLLSLVSFLADCLSRNCSIGKCLSS